MVELVVVVLIVGVLAAMAMPMMKGRTDSSKWSEAKLAMGTIAHALRMYGHEVDTFSGIPTLAAIGISDSDLDGTYFTREVYVITSASVSGGQTSFVITCTAADSARADAPTSPAVMTLTCNADNGYVATFAGSGGE
jgi:type II secretory pathway pseudopilin PulG